MIHTDTRAAEIARQEKQVWWPWLPGRLLKRMAEASRVRFDRQGGAPTLPAAEWVRGWVAEAQK